MIDNFGLKLIAVADRFNLVLYEAKGLKIQSGPQQVTLEFPTHHKKERHEGYFQKKSDPVGAFEPHTSPETIDEMNAAKLICNHLEGIVEKYGGLIIIAGPKMLGHIRQSAGHSMKHKITKEINKDMVLHDKRDIEKVVFG